MSEVTELVRERVGIIVTRGLDGYGYFPVEEDRNRFYTVAVDLLLKVTERIESGAVVSLSPLRESIISGVFTLGFDRELAKTLFSLVSESLYLEIDQSGLVDPETVRTYKKYEVLLAESLDDVELVLRTGLIEYLGSIPEYGTANTVVTLPPTRSRLLRVNRRAGQPPVRSRLTDRYVDVFNRSVQSRSDVVSNASPDINGITSDSNVPPALPTPNYDLLPATFAGEGNKVWEDVERLYNFSVELGGYEGSLVGAVDYQYRYYEYLMAMSYGKRMPGGLLGGEFGRFEEIYAEKADETSVPGLKFLEPIFTTRSGNQYVGSRNPVADRYSSGILDRYVPPATPKVDFVSLTLESIYTLCLRVGDTVRSLLNRPPEGIGNTKLHLSALAEVFPSSNDIRIRSKGVTGAMGSLLNAHRGLYALLGYEPDLHDFNDKFNTLSGLVEGLADTIRAVGFKPGGFVPSLQLTSYEPDRSVVEKRLREIGFTLAEVQEIMSVESIEELINRFAPISDSQDVISFFRAYDLTKLLYEFGGQEAIDQFTNFLYGVDQGSAVLRLLERLDVNRSLASKIRGSEFSRLIGYVVTLTYAVDPGQLVVFNDILKGNNLDLFQSITQLFNNGFSTILKTPDNVSLLSGMVAQMVTVDNSGYEDQKPLWNKLIEQSAGNVGTGVEGLYNRVDGITPTELYFALNKPSASSPLGKMLDGVRGGRMTSLLRYCNVFGLLYTLSPYRNSGQLVNLPAEKFGTMLELVDGLEILSERLYIANIILDDFAQGDRTEEVYTDPIVTVQNKEFSAMIGLLNGGTVDNVPIIESPGIGNSRIPNGVRISNSLTPEEAAIVSRTGSELGVFTSKPVDLGVESGSYVRISTSNLLVNGIESGMDTTITSTGNGDMDVYQSPLADYTTRYEPVTSNGAASSPPSSMTFNPITSCKRFGGGSSCDRAGYDPSQLCGSGYRKALFPETGYGTSSSSPAVRIDRPLGSRTEGVVTYSTTPKGHPQLPFTANGLAQLSRSYVLKDTEMMCASLKDPFEYGACMSLLKCKKFRPPYEGRYSFPFCPSTTHGGRLK